MSGETCFNDGFIFGIQGKVIQLQNPTDQNLPLLESQGG